jgi:hypothetical protein
MFEAIKHATTRKVELAEQSRFIGQREAKSPDRLKVDTARKLNNTTHLYGCGECETSTGDDPRGRQEGRK